MTQNINNIQSEIGKILYNLCPVSWDSIYLFSHCSDIRSDLYFCVKESLTKAIITSNYFYNRYDNETKQKERDTKHRLLTLLIDLHKAYTEKFGKEKTWSTITYILQSSGKFDIDFTYDEGETIIITREQWETKYFGEPVKFIQVKYPGTKAIG